MSEFVARSQPSEIITLVAILSGALVAFTALVNWRHVRVAQVDSATSAASAARRPAPPRPPSASPLTEGSGCRRGRGSPRASWLCLARPSLDRRRSRRKLFAAKARGLLLDSPPFSCSDQGGGDS